MLTAIPAAGWSIAGRYQVLSLIGQGGQSRVYLALDRTSGEKRVIKELREDVADVNAARRALLLEGELLKRLSHPGLPPVREILDRGDSAPLLIIRDYVEGTSLWDLLRRDGPMNQKKAVRLGLQICRILSYLHRQDPPVIYRDLKPGNLLMTPAGELRLIDFGCARYLTNPGDLDTVPLGTPGYAAPEQFGTGACTDQRTDIYGFGATMFQLLTGVNPASLSGAIPPIRTIRPALSAALERILLRCLSPDPADRYPSFEELARALTAWQRREPLRTMRHAGKHLSLAAAILLTVLLVSFARPRVSMAGSSDNAPADPAQSTQDPATLAFYREMAVLIRCNRQTLLEAGMKDEELEEILRYIAGQLETQPDG